MKADMADDELFRDTKHIKQVNRMIKNTFMERLEKQNSDKKKQGNIHETDKQTNENQTDPNLKFDAARIEVILKGKMRRSIYDIKEDDFLRVKSIRQKHQENSKEELDELLEEIGDIDPLKIKQINE